MAKRVKGYALAAPGQKFEILEFDLKPLEPHEIEVKVTHCSICHSDVHLLDQDWGPIEFPHIVGHEIIGTVAAIGSQVNGLTIGQRVGVGWQKGSCFQCEFCNFKHKEHLCDKIIETAASGNYGGFAESVVADYRFAYPIPNNIESEYAAPLLCAGQTVFTPLLKYGITKGHRVGIIGIGGLGHLAIKFASKMGAEVFAFSSSKDKEADVKKYGATSLILINDLKEIHRLRKIDFILVTAGYSDVNWSHFINILSKDGTICFVASANSGEGTTVQSPLATIFAGAERQIAGCNTGSIQSTKEMLNFAAQHGIKPDIEKYPFSEIDAAFEKTRSGKARYRTVLIR